jgi:hypothetical protein
MSSKSPYLFSRRSTLAGFAAAAAYGVAGKDPAAAEPPPNSARVGTCSGPTFSSTGPDAELYGAAADYPVPDVALAKLQGNPWEPKYRVGAFSHLDEIYATRRVNRAATPWTFKCSRAEIYYLFRGKQFSSIDYLSRNAITGLLITKDEKILFEHYQYGRTHRDRLLSQSMVKSITGMLIGIAISEGAIKSVDDTADTYVPGFKGTEYGRTPIRDLLHMSSGVDFGEACGPIWSLRQRISGKARSTASYNSIIGSPHRGQDTTMRASSPMSLGWFFTVPSTSPRAIIYKRRCGSR